MISVFFEQSKALFACLIQIGTNLSNDLFDYLKGTDNSSRLGPDRAMQAGIISKQEIIKAIFIALIKDSHSSAFTA